MGNAAYEAWLCSAALAAGKCGPLSLSFPQLLTKAAPLQERWFQSPRDPECGLTIAGFYYLCLCRQDGSIQGFYHDPSSNPYQRLSLKAGSSGASGHASGHYEFMP